MMNKEPIKYINPLSSVALFVVC